MKKNPYKRKPGDFEIRVLPDGRVVMIAPDETLIEIAESLKDDHKPAGSTQEKKKDA
jgi:hypothetical protein